MSLEFDLGDTINKQRAIDLIRNLPEDGEFLIYTITPNKDEEGELIDSGLSILSSASDERSFLWLATDMYHQVLRDVGIGD